MEKSPESKGESPEKAKTRAELIATRDARIDEAYEAALSETEEPKARVIGLSTIREEKRGSRTEELNRKLTEYTERLEFTKGWQEKEPTHADPERSFLLHMVRATGYRRDILRLLLGKGSVNTRALARALDKVDGGRGEGYFDNDCNIISYYLHAGTSRWEETELETNTNNEKPSKAPETGQGGLGATPEATPKATDTKLEESAIEKIVNDFYAHREIPTGAKGWSAELIKAYNEKLGEAKKYDLEQAGQDPEHLARLQRRVQVLQQFETGQKITITKEEIKTALDLFHYARSLIQRDQAVVQQAPSTSGIPVDLRSELGRLGTRAQETLDKLQELEGRLKAGTDKAIDQFNRSFPEIYREAQHHDQALREKLMAQQLREVMEENQELRTKVEKLEKDIETLREEAAKQDARIEALEKESLSRAEAGKKVRRFLAAGGITSAAVASALALLLLGKKAPPPETGQPELKGKPPIVQPALEQKAEPTEKIDSGDLRKSRGRIQQIRRAEVETKEIKPEQKPAPEEDKLRSAHEIINNLFGIAAENSELRNEADRRESLETRREKAKDFWLSISEAEREALREEYKKFGVNLPGDLDLNQGWPMVERPLLKIGGVEEAIPTLESHREFRHRLDYAATLIENYPIFGALESVAGLKRLRKQIADYYDQLPWGEKDAFNDKYYSSSLRMSVPQIIARLQLIQYRQ